MKLITLALGLLIGLAALSGRAYAECTKEVQPPNTTCTGPVSGTASAGASFKPIASPIVGLAQSEAMSLSGNAAAATFTALQLVVGPGGLSGLNTVVNNYSQSLNTATTGAGGMDTGAAPTSGYLDVYAIVQVSAADVVTSTSILGCADATCTGSQFYSGANMPTGYTQSALIAIVPTDASAHIVAGVIFGKLYSYVKCPAMFPAGTSGTVALARSSILSGAPPEAISATGFLATITGNNSTLFSVAADPGGTGLWLGGSESSSTTSTRACSGATVVADAANFSVPITTPQVLWWADFNTRPSENMYITSYTRQ